MQLTLACTEYRELLFSNAHCERIVREFGGHNLACALGISVVMISADDRILLIQRSQEVGEGPGALDVVGGHIHPNEHRAAEAPDPFLAIQDEIVEETGVDPGAQPDLHCIGLIETSQNQKPELAFEFQSDLRAAAIIAAGESAGSPEVHSFLTIANDAIHDFLGENQSQISHSAQGVLWLYADLLSQAPK